MAELRVTHRDRLTTTSAFCRLGRREHRSLDYDKGSKMSSGSRRVCFSDERRRDYGRAKTVDRDLVIVRSGHNRDRHDYGRAKTVDRDLDDRGRVDRDFDHRLRTRRSRTPEAYGSSNKSRLYDRYYPEVSTHKERGIYRGSPRRHDSPRRSHSREQRGRSTTRGPSPDRRRRERSTSRGRSSGRTSELDRWLDDIERRRIAREKTDCPSPSRLFSRESRGRSSGRGPSPASRAATDQEYSRKRKTLFLVATEDDEPNRLIVGFGMDLEFVVFTVDHEKEDDRYVKPKSSYKITLGSDQDRRTSNKSMSVRSYKSSQSFVGKMLNVLTADRGTELVTLRETVGVLSCHFKGFPGSVDALRKEDRYTVKITRTERRSCVCLFRKFCEIKNCVYCLLESLHNSCMGERSLRVTKKRDNTDSNRGFIDKAVCKATQSLRYDEGPSGVTKVKKSPRRSTTPPPLLSSKHVGEEEKRRTSPTESPRHSSSRSRSSSTSSSSSSGSSTESSSSSSRVTSPVTKKKRVDDRDTASSEKNSRPETPKPKSTRTPSSSKKKATVNTDNALQPVVALERLDRPETPSKEGSPSVCSTPGSKSPSHVEEEDDVDRREWKNQKSE